MEWDARTLHNQNSEISSVNGTPALLVSNNSQKYESNFVFAQRQGNTIWRDNSRRHISVGLLFRSRDLHRPIGGRLEIKFKLIIASLLSLGLNIKAYVSGDVDRG